MPHSLRLASVLLVVLSVAACGTEDPLPPAGGGGSGGSGGGGSGGLSEPATLETTLLQPAESVTIAPGVPVAIEWASSADDAVATVEIVADADGDPATTADQLRLAGPQPAATAAARIDWRTDDVSVGTYHVVARTTDALGSRTSVAAGLVEVVEPLLAVDNLAAGETLRYPLALLRGAVPSDAHAVLAGTSDASMREWPAYDGRFKALVPLAPGANDVLLAVDGVLHRVVLTYEPMENPRFVRFIYVLPAEGEGDFDAPAGEPNDVASALRRMATAADLMQTFTAEAMEAQGFGRRTFRVPRDESGAPIVETFRSSLTLEEARAMEGGDLWNHFYGELGRLPDRNVSIDVVVMSMTHYDPAQGRALAHTALGGGRLGLFGSGALHTWAESLDEVVERFTDDRRIDTAELLDDSAGRGTYWANFATGAGATLHELGHCLSLPHPANGIGVMARQFDHFNRTFVLEEPESETSSGLLPVLPEHEIGWDRSGAVRLGFHRWLDADDVLYAVNQPPRIADSDTSVTFSSAAGIRHIAWSVEGSVAGHDEFLDDAPASVTAEKGTLSERFPSAESLGVSVIDADGNIAEREIPLR